MGRLGLGLGRVPILKKNGYDRYIRVKYWQVGLKSLGEQKIFQKSSFLKDLQKLCL